MTFVLWFIFNVKIFKPLPIFSRWTKQNILLDNPTDETLELIPALSNTNNFSLERDNERPIILAPNSSLEIPLHFMPSTLGEGDHLAKITFLSEQVGVLVGPYFSGTKSMSFRKHWRLKTLNTRTYCLKHVIWFIFTPEQFAFLSSATTTIRYIIAIC